MKTNLMRASHLQMFSNPSKASRKSTLEVQQMEAQMQHNLLLHKKSLNDRQQQLNSLLAGINKKSKLNKQLQIQILDLAEMLDSQVPAIDAMTGKRDMSRSVPQLNQRHLTTGMSHRLAVTSPLAHCLVIVCRSRLKGLAAAKKLKDISRAQQAEVTNLKATLHKLHLRSHPAFVDPAVPEPSHPQADTIPAARGRPGDVL
jgi:ATP-dependent 26S proteasome regulatory subunit